MTTNQTKPRAYYTTRSAVRGIFYTALALTPYLLAGTVSALVGDPLLIAHQ